jgi:signal transduction histidine kinase
VNDTLLHHLQQFAEALDLPQDVQALAQGLAERVVVLLSAAGSQVFEVDLEHRCVRQLAQAGAVDPQPVEAPFGSGLAGQVAASGATLAINGAAQAAVGLPLRWRGQLNGVLLVYGVSEFPEYGLAELLATQAAAALGNALSRAAAQRYAEQMRLVNEIGRDISGLLEAEAIMAQVSRRLEASFGYAMVRLGLIVGGEVIFPARDDDEHGQARTERRLPLAGAGLVARVARDAVACFISDIVPGDDHRADALLPATRAVAVLPLVAHARTLGVLDVQSDRPLAWSTEEVSALEMVCAQAAVALDNAGLFAEARQRAAEVSALLATSLAVTAATELGARLEAIAHHARSLADADACTIYKLSPDGRHLLPLIALDALYAEETLADMIVVGDGLIGAVAQSGRGEIFNRADLHPRAQQIPGTPLTPECLMAVPLLVGERTTGVMAVYREGERAYSAHDFDLLSSFAAQAAAAIENAELYQALRERADSLQATYDELAEMDRLKDEMVQNISHELRTPLTFLRSYVELLISGELGPLLPEQQRSLQIVRDKTDTLVRLVSDIITLQAVTPATIARAPVELVDLAKAAVDGVAAAAQEAGVALLGEYPAEPVEVGGDALRLTQVFDNLLGNAIKFTPRGGRVALAVQPGPAWVRVEVRDSGIGIPPEDVERVFERFFQVDGTATRRRGGIGLGLAICKLIVEVHGGHIAVESQVGAGSCFYFVLPRAEHA